MEGARETRRRKKRKRSGSSGGRKRLFSGSEHLQEGAEGERADENRGKAEKAREGNLHSEEGEEEGSREEREEERVRGSERLRRKSGEAEPTGRSEHTSGAVIEDRDNPGSPEEAEDRAWMDEVAEGDVELFLDEIEDGGEVEATSEDQELENKEKEQGDGRERWEFIEESSIDVEIEEEAKIEEEVFGILRNEVAEICQSIRLKTGVLRNSDVTLEHLLDLFLPGSLVSLFSRVMKSTMVSRGQRVLRSEEMSHAFKVLLCCVFYDVSITKVFEANHFQYYPLLQKAGVRIEEKKRILEVLKGLEGVPRRHRGSTWDPKYGADRDLLECERELSRAASGIGYTGHTIFSTDDDHLRLRSHLPSETGVAQVHNPAKAFGPVQHCMVSSLTQFWLSGHYQSVLKESATHTVQLLLQYVTGSMDAESIVVREQKAVLDRGYLCPSLINYFNRIGMNYIGTHRRCSSFPFTFGRPARRRSQRQREVEERGARARHWARYRNSETRSRGRKRYSDYALAFRDSVRGNVALMATNDSTMLPGRLVFKISGGREPTNQETPACLRRLEQSLISLTRGQGGQEWFILRAFRFTSSTVTPALRMAEALLRDSDGSEMCGLQVELEELQRVLNIRQIQTQDAPALPSTSLSSHLLGRSVQELKGLCRERGLRVAGNKGDLVKRLASYNAGPADARKEEFLKKLFGKWFMRPVTSHELSLGRANEELAARGLIPFLEVHARNLSLGIVCFRGLQIRRCELWMASSVDALLIFSSSSEEEERVGCVEIKTMTARSTLESARERGRKEKYKEIHISAGESADQLEQFREFVPSVEHRAQLLHHASTFGTSDVFYCISSLTKIIYVVRIIFSEVSLRAHSNVLNGIVQTQLRWIYREEEFPTFEGFEKRDFCWAGHRDAVLFSFKIWKALTERVMRLKEPLPRAHYIRPRLVYLWNTLKGGVDVYSRVMSNNKFHIKGIGSKAEFYIRAFLTAVYNAHICRRLLMAESYLDGSTGSYSRFRNRLNQYGSMRDTILDILEGSSLSLDGRIFRNCVLETPAVTNNILTQTHAHMGAEELLALRESIPSRRTRLDEFFDAWNSPLGRKMRQSGLHKERLIGYTTSGSQIRKWCRYCSRFQDGKEYGYKTAFCCRECFDTPLCRFIRKDARGRRNSHAKCCFEKWHETPCLKPRETKVRDHRRGGRPDPRLKGAANASTSQ